MNKTDLAIRIGAVCIVSLAAGAATTFYFLDNHYEKQISDLEADVEKEAKASAELRIEVAELKKRLETKPEDILIEKELTEKELFEKERRERLEQTEVVVDEEEKRVDYTRIKSSDDVRKALGLETPAEEAAAAEMSHIYVIAFDEYATNNGYTKSALMYYNIDGILADEALDQIGNIEKVIGLSLNHFGLDSLDDDTVYVRNENLNTDYEVMRLEKSYQEEVLGITPDEVDE